MKKEIIHSVELLVCLTVVCVCLAENERITSPRFPVEIVRGDLGEWKVYKGGIKINRPGADIEPRSRKTIHSAFWTAREKDIASFAKYFIVINEKSIPDDIKILYNRWRSIKDKSYGLIPVDALLLSDGKETPYTWAALGVTTLFPASEEEAEMDVLFLRFVNNEWKITLENPDKKMSEYLAQYKSHYVPTTPEEIEEYRKNDPVAKEVDRLLKEDEKDPEFLFDFMKDKEPIDLGEPEEKRENNYKKK